MEKNIIDTVKEILGGEILNEVWLTIEPDQADTEKIRKIKAIMDLMELKNDFVRYARQKKDGGITYHILPKNRIIMIDL